MCSLRFIVLKIMIQGGLIHQIELEEQETGRYTVKVIGNQNPNFESLETGEYLMGEKNRGRRSYSSVDRAMKSLRGSGYKGDFTIITYKKMAA